MYRFVSIKLITISGINNLNLEESKEILNFCKFVLHFKIQNRGLQHILFVELNALMC